MDEPAGVRRAREDIAAGERVLADRLRAVPARKPVGAYPQVVRDRLASLQAQAVKQGIDWQPREAIKARPGPRPEEGWTGLRAAVGVAGCLVFTVGIWLVGLAVILLFFAEVVR